MNFSDQGVVTIAYFISNLVGLLFLWAAIKRTRLARLMFVLLFAWACWVNYTTSHTQPGMYLSYAEKAIGWYRAFINGWFSGHITAFVSTIAIGQGLIALGMLLKGRFVKLACFGAILFLLAIAPLGVYAGFPFSITVSIAAWLVLRKDDMEYLWKSGKKKVRMVL